jgi:RimJ/RimL family protein N-acetyltransferase
MHLSPTYPVLTQRLRLRPVTTDDVEAMLAYRGRADVCRFLPFEPMTRERLIERVTGDLGLTTLTESGQALTLGVESASTGALLGDVVLMFHSSEQRAGEVGWVFHPDVAGHGYASEASAALLALAFEDLGLHRVVARIDARNDSSARLATRLGMRQEAHLISNEWLKGEWTDEIIFAMLEDEWALRRKASR